MKKVSLKRVGFLDALIAQKNLANIVVTRANTLKIARPVAYPKVI